MPLMKLGTSTRSRSVVLRAMEKAAGLPLGQGGDDAWLRQVVEKINDDKDTDIKYDHEDYGYLFAYGSPASAVLLGEIKKSNNL